MSPNKPPQIEKNRRSPTLGRTAPRRDGLLRQGKVPALRRVRAWAA